jgi:CHAT domain-containing protein
MRSVIVAMPTTDLNEPLAHVRREAGTVAALLPDTTVLIDPPPTKRAVLELLTDSAVAHFACHSVADPHRPAAGKLLLHDHHDDPLTVADVMAHRLDHGRLAYLSACRTAVVAATDLIDEVTHLTTAFQLAGYPHVVGTLWEINDPLAADIAHDFYRNLCADGQLDPTRSALALHHAVRTVRDKLPMTPTLWAAHIHSGA